jgi:hypothetical protein
VYIPQGVKHDFRNESVARMGLLNVFLPGGFEPMMTPFVEWFAENPPEAV